MDEKGIVYWERQEKDEATCGVHCLNTLLQGPYFDEVQLSSIALALDKREMAIMGGKKISQVFFRFTYKISIPPMFQKLVTIRYKF